MLNVCCLRCKQAAAYNNNKFSPKSFGNSRIATPYCRKWTQPLSVLAVQCLLQTSPACWTYATSTPHRHTRTAYTAIAYTKSEFCRHIEQKSQALRPIIQCRQVICEELHSHPQMNSPVLCAQCSLQTSPVTQRRVRHNHNAVPVSHST